MRESTVSGPPRDWKSLGLAEARGTSEKPTTRVHHHTSSTMSSSVSSSPIPLEFEFDVAQQTTPISEETSPEPGTNTAASSPPAHASSEYSFASSELAEVCVQYLKHAQFY